MKQSANVTSIDAVRNVRLAMLEYQEELRDAMTTLMLEARRAADWIESDRARYWPDQVRKASDGVIEARNNLERCELEVRPEDKRSCVVEKKALEKAKRRLRYCESKVQAVRHWQTKVRREIEEFQGSLAKMNSYADIDLPKAVAHLERMAAALDKYAAAHVQPPSGDALQNASEHSSTKSRETRK